MIDSHAHLDMDRFDADRDQVIARAKREGVHTILSLAMIDEIDSYQRAFPLVSEHELVTAVGCHPHDAKIFDDKGGEELLKELASRNAVVAIGEIGLDYHYNLSTPEVQQDVFRRQIRLARELELPVIVHHRDAEADLARILEQENASEVRGILHSFTASLETAEAAVDHGFLISFSGIVTFKNAESLQAVARVLPLDKILVETDCPYLAPVPHRGKRNEPVFVKETAAFLARLKGVSEASVEAATDANFQQFFGI
ncbi:MAG: TatD family hydrolase [Acidobacteriota bacterium]|nr:MAG: TatD family hydrolase [Acidobacteriota bacterium]